MLLSHIMILTEVDMSKTIEEYLVQEKIHHGKEKLIRTL